VQQLLRSSSCLRVLRLQGSRRAGVTLLPALAPLATAAAGSLQELQLLNAVPHLQDSGYIPYLREFQQLCSLTLASPAVGMKVLLMQTLPPSLQQLHLEGLMFSCKDKPVGTLVSNTYDEVQQLTADLVKSDLEIQVKHPDAGDHVQQDAAGHVTTEAGTMVAGAHVQHAAGWGPPGAATMSGGSTAATAPATAKAIEAAASGEYAAEFMHTKYEGIRGQAMPRYVAEMPRLHRLHLVRCNASSADCASLPMLLQWAGPCLQEAVLIKVYSNEQRTPTPGAQIDAVPLPRLRRFDWVDCNLPMVANGDRPEVTQLLTFLQANAPQLQQLKVFCGEARPVTDLHVPLLLAMKQLRRLELFVLEDKAGDLEARCVLPVVQLSLL
jgi:hypothetical protein